MSGVRTEVRDGILVITIDRPEARNAVDGQVATGIAAALDVLDSNIDLSVGILRVQAAHFALG